MTPTLARANASNAPENVRVNQRERETVMNDDTKTRKAILRDSFTDLVTLLWLLFQVVGISYLACKLTNTWPQTICAFLVGVFYLASCWVTSFRIEQACELKKLRKTSPRANFFKLLDCDEEIQALKRKAHCAENPQQFEEALIQIANRFYNEGYATEQVLKA